MHTNVCISSQSIYTHSLYTAHAVSLFTSKFALYFTVYFFIQLLIHVTVEETKSMSRRHKHNGNISKKQEHPFVPWPVLSMFKSHVTESENKEEEVRLDVKKLQ